MIKLNTIYQTDCLAGLALVSSNTVNTCVTSPPYYGLRDYGVKGQIGLERTPEQYIDRLVKVFREVRRVLRNDGTLWLNMGDSYTGSGKGQTENGCADPKNKKTQGMKLNKSKGLLLKPKNLMGMPWRVAFALQADGWYLRQDIIWAKPNPMPESVKDRCTKSHEYIFLLSKSPKYYYDQEAILEPVSQNTHMRISQDLANQIGSFRANGGTKSNGPMKAVSRKTKQGETGVVKNNPSFDKAVCLPVEQRNKRDVWTVATQPFSGAHFAVFPKKLIEPCILAGCPKGGIVLDPFIGSGTTAQVAIELQRNFIGFELNGTYKDMADNNRLAAVQQRLF